MCLLSLSSRLRLSLVSVVFDFNVSLNDVPPVSPISFTVVEKRNEKSELLMDAFCVSSIASRLRWSIVSVVFDFSDSLNDVTPVSPILLPVDRIIKPMTPTFFATKLC